MLSAYGRLALVIAIMFIVVTFVLANATSNYSSYIEGVKTMCRGDICK